MPNRTDDALKCIVKVQRPKDGKLGFVVSDRELKRVTRQPLGHEALVWLGEDEGGYFIAVWSGEHRLWGVTERVENQGW